MKRRNREVNIFNMSLLDILCGALGAFCFMMLALFPDHLRAKAMRENIKNPYDNEGAQARAEEAERKQQEAEDRANEAEKRAKEAEKNLEHAKDMQSLTYFQVWWPDDVDVDIWVQFPDGRWVLPKKELVPKEKLFGETYDEKKGPAKELVWQADVSGYKHLSYRLFAKWQAGEHPGGQVRVNGYIAARVPMPNQSERSRMTLEDLGIVRIEKLGDRVELGSIVFEGSEFTITRGPSPDPPTQGR